MSHTHTLCTRLAVVMVVPALGLLAGCAAKKYVMVEKPEGVMLEYKMPAGDVLTYKSSQQSTQTMEPMGLPMETKVTKSYEFALEPKGEKGGAYDLKVTINSMDAGINTVQGDFSADVEPVVGKSFGMSMSRLGEVLDVSEAEPIQYGVGPEGTRSIMPDFKLLFPHLPETPVSIGDTWTSQHTLNMKEGGIDIVIVSEGVNTVVAFEPMGGFECGKVTTEITGTVSGKGEQQGAQVGFDGTMTGTETWYFAHEAGRLIELSGNVFTKATINVTGPSEISFPMTERTSSEVMLVK